MQSSPPRYLRQPRCLVNDIVMKLNRAGALLPNIRNYVKMKYFLYNVCLTPNLLLHYLGPKH